jgi:hypothetical protein
MAGYRVKSGVTKCAHEIVPQFAALNSWGMLLLGASSLYVTNTADVMNHAGTVGVAGSR